MGEEKCYLDELLRRKLMEYSKDLAKTYTLRLILDYHV